MVSETPAVTDGNDSIDDESLDIEAFINERINSIVRESEGSGGQSHNDNETENDDCSDVDLQSLRQKISQGCGCKKNCFEQFQENVIYDNVLNISEMDKDQRELVIMSNFEIKHKDSTSTKRGLNRKQYHCVFRFNGREVCRETFKVAYNFGEVSLRNIVSHVKTHGVVPRVHGNRGKKPHNAFNFDDIMRMVTFIRNYADEHGMPLPAPEHGRDTLPPIYLPSSDTKMNVHKKYQEACANAQQRTAKYKSFYGI